MRPIQPIPMLSDPGLFRDQAFINGRWLDAAAAGLRLPVQNPATRDTIGHVPLMGEGETRDAILAAHAAWPDWRGKNRPRKTRNRYFRSERDMPAPKKTPGCGKDPQPGIFVRDSYPGVPKNAFKPLSNVRP